MKKPGQSSGVQQPGPGSNIEHAETGSPGLRTNSLYTHKWTIATLALSIGFVWAAWPGWMTGDSGTQWMEATGRTLVSDWHSAQLSRLWGLLDPDRLGPTGPFLLQCIFYFSGVTLVVRWSERRSGLLAGLTVMVATVAPFTWTVGYVWKDSFLVSMLAFATGACVTASSYHKKPRVAFSAVAGLALGAAGLGRPYMVPVLVMWAIGTLLLLWPAGSRLAPLAATLAALTVSYALLTVFWPKIQPAYPAYVAGSTQLQDLSRIECRTRDTETTTPKDGVLPRQFIVNPNEADICEKADPNTWDNMAWLSLDSVHVRLPQSAEEASQLRRAWLDGALAYPSVLLAAKVEAFVQLITMQDNQELLSLERTPSVRGAVGGVDPQVRSFPSRGGLLLATLAAPSQILYLTFPVLKTGFFWVVIGPVGILLTRFGKRCLKFRPWGAVLVSSSGMAWALLIAASAPAIATRYWEPGALMAAASVVLVSGVGMDLNGTNGDGGRG